MFSARNSLVCCPAGKRGRSLPHASSSSSIPVSITFPGSRTSVSGTCVGWFARLPRAPWRLSSVSPLLGAAGVTAAPPAEGVAPGAAKKSIGTGAAGVATGDEDAVAAGVWAPLRMEARASAVRALEVLETSVEVLAPESSDAEVSAAAGEEGSAAGAEVKMRGARSEATRSRLLVFEHRHDMVVAKLLYAVVASLLPSFLAPHGLTWLVDEFVQLLYILLVLLRVDVLQPEEEPARRRRLVLEKEHPVPLPPRVDLRHFRVSRENHQILLVLLCLPVLVNHLRHALWGFGHLD